MIQPVMYMMYVIYALIDNKSLPLKQILAIVLFQAKEHFTRDGREVP